MSWLDVIGDIGTVWDATSRANQAREDRDYQIAKRQQDEERAKIQAEMDRANMDEFKRQQELEKRIREVMSSGTMTEAQPARPAMPAQTVSDLDTPPDMQWAPGRAAMAEVPGRVNQIELARKAARVAQEGGDWKRADEFNQRAKLYKQEGLTDLASDLMGGRDPAEAIRDFNSKGIFRISEDNAEVDPNTKTLRYRDANGRPIEFNPQAFLGKMPKDQVLSEGQILTRDGKVIASNPRNRTGEMDEKLKRDKELEQFKANLKAKADRGDQKATAEIQNLTFIAEQRFGGDISKAIDLKFAAQDKSRTQVVRDMLQLVKDDFTLDTPDKKLAAAEKLADSLMGRETNTRGAVRATPKANKPATKPQETKDLNGKRYEKIDGQWFEVN